ncbi:hypothetical protein MCEKH45_01928 [Methylophilaceae bacterium]
MNISSFAKTIIFIAVLLLSGAGFKFNAQTRLEDSRVDVEAEDAVAHVRGEYYGNIKGDVLDAQIDEEKTTRNYFLLSGVITLIIGFGLKMSAASSDAESDIMKCPNCAEAIKREAKFCRFCQKEIV